MANNATLVLVFEGNSSDFHSRLSRILDKSREEFETLGVDRMIITINETAEAVIRAADVDIDGVPNIEADPPLNYHFPDDTSINEVDRNARAYGFEIGRGKEITREILEASPDNPFMHPFWRARNGLE